MERASQALTTDYQMFNSFKNIFFGSKRIEEGISV
jgi:hypothetical protein